MSDKTEFVRVLKHGAPDIGDIFMRQGDLAVSGQAHTYRVGGWLKEVPLSNIITGDFLKDILIEQSAKSAEDITGKRDVVLVWCERHEATHVTGSGVGGCIAHIQEIKVVGRVSWPPEHILEARESHARSIGDLVL